MERNGSGILPTITSPVPFRSSTSFTPANTFGMWLADWSLADKDWRSVDLPHDWSIEGPYSAKNAAGTAFLPAGIGWYRKTFQLPASLSGRKISIRFDGVYRDSIVWVNGPLLGSRPYGYATFDYDLTPHLHLGGSNVLSVRVDHSVLADSRWYPGSGIYRHVWLNITGPVHIRSEEHTSE